MTTAADQETVTPTNAVAIANAVIAAGDALIAINSAKRGAANEDHLLLEVCTELQAWIVTKLETLQ